MTYQHVTAPTRFIETNGIRFAYRRFGQEGGTPLLFMQHFRGGMDHWDPAVTDGFAKNRPVILFDNAGVASSSGETPDTIDAMAEHAADFVGALGISQIDLLGFSIGGYIAQTLTIRHPELIRRLILVGTGPRAGEPPQDPKYAEYGSLTDPKTGQAPLEAFLYLFFRPSETSQFAGKAFWARRHARKEDVDVSTSAQTMAAQRAAITEWRQTRGERFAELKAITQPTLVVNGHNDIMVPTINSFTLSQKIPDAQLIVYPDAGHGSLFQFPELFVTHGRIFLDGPLPPPRPRELPDTQRSNPRVLRPAPAKPRQAMKIAILDDYQNVALSTADWSAVAKKADITVFNDHIDQTDALIERLLPFDVICVMRERTALRRDIIERLPRLRFIASTGPRNISIDIAAANERGILVANTGYRSTPTIELTWALILASARHLVGESNSIRAGGWQTSIRHELDGRILGVLGLGNVGGQVARIGRAFGMKIIAWSQNLTAEAAEAAGAELVTKNGLFRQADIVTIHLILSERTRGLVGAAELALMKPTARLVNTSRGPIVDEQALIEVLRAGTIAGAAVDVFDTEPLPAKHPFRSLQNLLATPHIGFVAEDLYRTFYGDAAAAIGAWIEKQVLSP